MRRTLSRFVLAFALVVGLGACSSPGVTSVVIDGGDRTIVVGDVYALTVTVATSGGASPAVSWESGNESVAVVDGAGIVTGLASGVTAVTAVSIADPSRSDTVTVTVDPLGVVQWTRQFGTDSDDVARGVATDADGNVYVAGATRGDLEGGNAGGFDIFVRTYDGDGGLRGTRQIGTSSDDLAYDVATDAEGNLYVVGVTRGALDGVDAGIYDAFVLSLDPDGVLRWTRQFGTSSADFAFGVATDADGNVYVAGFTYGALDGANAGGSDAFVRSFDRDGVHRWTRQFGTGSDDEGFAVATDSDGNVYVTGFTDGALVGDQAGARDAFVRSFDGDGALRWTRQFGSASTDEAHGVATDASGNVYVVGFTGGALEGVGAGGDDAFVRSYDGDGALRWTRQFGTGSNDEASGVATDASGNVYLVGYTGGALEGASTGAGDAFIRSYDGAGDLRWTSQFGSGFLDVALAVTTDARGGVYVAGFTFGALAGTNAGEEDAFLRKYGR